MKIEARMARFVINSNKIKQDGKFHYDDIIFLENPEIYPNLVIGKENSSQTFVGQSHFRGERSGNAFYVMVFKVIHLQKDEKPEDFKIYYTPKKGSEEIQLQFDEHHEVFFDEPKLKKDRKEYKFSNALDKVALGAINAGVFYLNIYKDDAKIPLNPNFYKVLILPSSLSFSSYQEMIDDILQIRKELIIEKTAGKQSVQLAWEHMLEEVNRVVDELTYPLSQINQKPKVKLNESYEKMPIRLVKKFNSKTLMQHLLNQGNIRTLSVTSSESTEIYENEMIYYALSKLKEYVKNYLIKKNNQLQIEAKEAEKTRAKILNEFCMDDLDELKNIMNNFNDPKVKEQFFESAVKSLDLNQEAEEDTMEIVINVHSNFWQDPKMSIGKGKLITIFGSDSFINNVFSLDYMKDSSYSIIGGQMDIPIRGRKTFIELHSPNLHQHVFFMEHLRNINYPQIICLHAIVRKHLYNTEDPLQGKPVQGYKNLYDYSLKILDLKAINNNPVVSYIQPENYLKYCFANYGNMLAIEERVKEIVSIQEKIENKKNNLQQFGGSKIQAHQVLTKIDTHLQLPLFQKMHQRKHHWRLTQIFINDTYYSRIWKLLRKLDKNYEFTDDFDQLDVVIKKADELYEYWIFITLINELTQSGWAISGKKSLIQAVNQFLRNSASWQPTFLEEIEIELKHPGKVKIDNDYKVCIEKINMTFFFNKEIAGKRPDYAIRIDVFHKDREIKELKCLTKWFYLDAKYRNYKDQGGKQYWYKDINDVAIEKYSNYFHSKKHPTNGAFIIHPDLEDKYTYYGGYTTEEMLKEILPLEEYTDRNPRHRFGSIACRPGHVGQLKLLIRMFLEYPFVSINTPFICFECGSSNTNIETKSTMGNNKKYHITCKNCGDFWVRTHCSENGHFLIKHQNCNFHHEESNSPWFVECPICNLSNSIQ